MKVGIPEAEGFGEKGRLACFFFPTLEATNSLGLSRGSASWQSQLCLYICCQKTKYLEEGEGVAKDSIFWHIQKIIKCQKWSLIHVLIDKILTQ